MKKITLIVLSLFVTLAIANPAYSGWWPGAQHVTFEGSCELVVVDSGSADPCVVVNRVGFKEGDKWILEANESACHDRLHWDNDGNEHWYDADNLDTYFRCYEQEYVAQNCDIKTIMTKASDDEDYCSVGIDDDGYETAAILFQMEHVPTPRLQINDSNHNLLENNDTAIDTIIKQSVTIRKGAGQQIIFSDVGSFFGTNLYSGNHGNAAYPSALINDEIFENPDVDFYKLDHFYVDDSTTTILDVENAYAVPIKVKDLASDKFAINFKGPSSLEDGLRTPRAVIRGWDLELHSGAGGVYTKDYFDLVFTRSRIQIRHDELEAALSLSRHTNIHFLPSPADHPAEAEDHGISLKVELNGYLDVPVFKFRDVPTSTQTLRNMAKGLHISYDKGISKNKHPMPLRIDKNGEEWIEPCTLIEKDPEDPDCNVYDVNNAYKTECIKCAQDDLGEGRTCTTYPELDDVVGCAEPYLVFKPKCTVDARDETQENCHFDIFLSITPIHLPEFKGAPKPIVYVIDAVGYKDIWFEPSELSGARIRHDYLNLPLPPE